MMAHVGLRWLWLGLCVGALNNYEDLFLPRVSVDRLIDYDAGSSPACESDKVWDTRATRIYIHRQNRTLHRTELLEVRSDGLPNHRYADTFRSQPVDVSVEARDHAAARPTI